MAFKCMQEYWELHCWQAEQEAKNDPNPAQSLLETAQSLARTIESRWTLKVRIDYAPDETDVEASLKALWHDVIAAVQQCNDSRMLESITDFMKDQKKLGILKRYVTAEGKPLPEVESVANSLIPVRQRPEDVPGSIEDEAVIKSYGKLWTDMPVLRQTLLQKFLQAPPITSPKAWTNLHTFAARLTTTKVCDLSFFCIWAFFDALETNKPFHNNRREGQKSLIDLLPSVLAWLDSSGELILTYSKTEAVPEDIAASQGYPCYQNGPAYVGLLAQQSGVEIPGFSMGRWVLWKKRLNEIAVATENMDEESDDVKEVGSMARRGLERMNHVESDTDS